MTKYNSPQPRSRNLPIRKATPPQLLPGYQAPTQQLQGGPKRRRQPSIRVPRLFNRRLTPRTIAIIHQTGEFQELVEPTNNKVNHTVLEAKQYLGNQLKAKMKFRKSRHGKFSLWMPSVVFANLIFSNFNEDNLRWTISKANPDRLATTRIRGTIASPREFSAIFGPDVYEKSDVDANKIAFITCIRHGTCKFSYCIESCMLNISFQFGIYRISSTGGRIEI